MNYYVSSGTLKPTRTLTHSLTKIMTLAELVMTKQSATKMRHRCLAGLRNRGRGSPTNTGSAKISVGPTNISVNEFHCVQVVRKVIGRSRITVSGQCERCHTF